MYQRGLTNAQPVQYASNCILGGSKRGINFCGRNHCFMKYFFWISFAVFLAASIPHVAYFFASFEPSQGPEGVWWWTVSYAIAISIDVTVYLLSWTAFQRYRDSSSLVNQHISFHGERLPAAGYCLYDDGRDDLGDR